MGSQKYSVMQREAHVRQYEESGLSATEYCKVHNIAQGTFYGWVKMMNKNVKNKEQIPQIYPLEIKEDNLSTPNQPTTPNQCAIPNQPTTPNHLTTLNQSTAPNQCAIPNHLTTLNQSTTPNQSTALNNTTISFSNGVKVEIGSLTASQLLTLINGYCNV